MKKILFFMFALLAFVACDNMFGGVDDSTAADVAGDVTIEFSAVGDYGFTVTLTPTRAASFYSYLVDDDDVDVSAELDASTLYSCGYSSVAKGTVNYSENPSYTFTLNGLDSDQTYYVYAVAGSPEGNVGAICAKSVVTNYVPVYWVELTADYDGDEDVVTASVSFSDDVDYVKVGIVEGTTYDELYAGIDDIIDGTVESKQIDEDGGEVQFTVTEDGDYIVLAVAFGGGEDQDYDYYTFSVDHSTWTSLGWCTYTDDFIASLYGLGAANCLTYEVEIEESDNTPGLYRLVNPYDEKYLFNDPGDWDEDNDYYLVIHAEDPDGVYIPECDTGVDWGYGNIIAWSMADYYMSYGYSLSLVKMMGYCGTYKDGVITFPQNGLVSYETGYPNDLYYANYYGMFKVVMPGTVILDCSVDIEYNGKFTDTRDSNFAVATVELGEDVEYALVAMAEGNDHDALVEAIKAGTVECQTLTQSGGVEFPCEETGIYTIAVVTYANDEPQESAYVTFTYSVGTTSEWTLYGKGDYYYSGFVFDGEDPGLEMYRNTVDPTRFKIEHWGYDVDFYFTWDEDSNVITVDDQETGATYGSYGDVYVTDLSDSWSNLVRYTTSGYHDDGVFYFAVEYYCSAGEFGIGFETFTLEGSTKAPALADIPGEFYFYEYSGYYYSLYGAEYAIEASDDSGKGNIMFTMFDDFDCDISSIYGTYDEETGIAEFGLDQFFGTYSYSFWGQSYSYELSFTTYYGSPAQFLFFKNGDIWGPFYGDYIAEEMYDSGVYDGDWDAYYFMYGAKENAAPGSVKPASASNKVDSHPAEPAKGELNTGKHLKASKDQIGKSKRVEVDGDIVLASSSTRPTGTDQSQKVSKKKGNKTVSGKVETGRESLKESVKESIREARGKNN